MADCNHSQCWSDDECRGLTPEQEEFGEKVRTVGLQFTYGRSEFHGRTIKERTDEMFMHAKNLGNEPPQYEGRQVLR